VYALHAGNPQWQTHARIDALLFGVILAYLFYIHYETFENLLKLRLALLLLIVGGLLFALHEGLDSRLMSSIGYTINYISLGSLLLLVYSYHGRLTKTLLYRAIAKIGLYSYGIYLWHYAVRDPLSRIAPHYPSGLRWGLLLSSQYLAAIILGIILTKAVEFPMLRLRDRLVPRGPAKPPSESAYVGPLSVLPGTTLLNFN
jgi:peptidoglycan/LPS O-acetylase OafA/YrhL